MPMGRTMHKSSLIPQEYRDHVHRATIALMRAYHDEDARKRADEHLARIKAMLSNRAEGRP